MRLGSLNVAILQSRLISLFVRLGWNRRPVPELFSAVFLCRVWDAVIYCAQTHSLICI